MKMTDELKGKLSSVERMIASKYDLYEKQIKEADERRESVIILEREAFLEGVERTVIWTLGSEAYNIIRDFIHDFESDYLENEPLFDENGVLKDEYLLLW